MAYRRKRAVPALKQETILKVATQEKRVGFANYWIWHELVLSYGKLRKNSKTKGSKRELNALGKQILLHYLKNFLYFPIWLVKFLTPSYFKGPVNVWTNLRTIIRSPEFRPLRLAIFSQLIFFAVVIRLGIFVFYEHSVPTQAASYGWVQTTWSGGTSTTLASHTNDRTGWTYFQSYSQLNMTASPGNIVLATSSYTTTDDGTLTTDGLASGGGFDSGTISSVVVSGSGSSAEINLSVASAGGEVLDWDSSPLTLPATISGTEDGNGAMVTDGSDAFYILRGGGTTGFYKFVPSTATTSTLTSVPSAIPPNGGGGSLVLSGDYIYVYSGGNSGPKFYAYSIAGDSWTTLTNPPSSPYGDGIGSTMAADAEGNIYLAAGGATTNFYKYTVSTAPSGSWSSAYTLGSSVRAGSRAIYDSVNNDVYILTGNNGHTVSKFDVDSSTVTNYAGAHNDSGFTTGGSMAIDTTDNRIYTISGQNYAWMEILNVSSGSWNSRQSSSTPVGPSAGGYMIKKNGEKRIYTSFGGTSFYWFSTADTGSWQMTTNTSPVPGSLGQGATLIRHSNDEIYALAGGGSTALYRFAINSGTQYNTSGNFISASLDLKLATSTRISWSANTPANTGSNSVKFQVAANTDNATWNYVGPDGTASTYFTTSDTVLPNSLQGKRYYRYKAYLTTSNASYTPTLNSVTFTYHGYLTSGSFVSSKFDSLDATNVLASIAWTASTTSGNSVKFQIRTSGDNNTWTNWYGPDGTTSTYFTVSSGSQSMPSALADGSDDEWMQYQGFFASDGTATPILEDVTLTYVVNAPPDISISTSTLAVASTGILTVPYSVRDIDNNTGVTPGSVYISLQYCTANCSNSGSETWATAASSSLSGDYGAVSIDSGTPTTYSDYTLTWTPTSSYNNQYNASDFKIRLRANDSEAANNIGSDQSNTFVLDTTDPVVSVIINGRSTTSTLAIGVTDDTSSGLQMKFSNRSDLAADGVNDDSGTWVAYASTSTWDLGSGGTTVYYQVKDIYGNVSADNVISSAQTPQIPGNLFFKDISNADTDEWREFIAWQIVDEPTPGFAQYTIYRSTDATNYAPIGTQVSRIVNYYLDTNIDTGTTYYYKVTAEDDDGNISNFSSVVSDDPDGQGGTDVAAPSISNVATSTLTSDSVTITWDTDEISDSYVDYITTEGGDFSSANTVGLTTVRNNAAGIGQHSIVLTDLSPETTYYFRVRSIDPDGNQGTGMQDPNGYVFTTLSGPTISSVNASNILNTEATITWTTDQASDSYVVYSTSSVFTASTTVGSPDSVTSHSVTLPSLTRNTTYYYFVVSGVAFDKNTVGGQNQYYNFQTTADLTAPTITFDSEDDVDANDTSLIITFSTNEPATSTLRYGTTNSYGSLSVNDNLNTNHRYSLTSLIPGTLYYFSIQATDEDGNESTATEASVSTSDTADYSAPVISSVTTSVVTDDQALIEWSTDESATGRVWYGTASSTYTHSSSLVSTLNRAHAITLTGLSTSTAYYYIVASVDSSGNSATSTQYTFTTLETLSEESEVQLREETARAEGVIEGNSNVSSGGGGGGGGSSTDRTLPVVSQVAVSNITSNGAKITWLTNEKANTLVEFGKTTQYGQGSLDLENVETHSINLVELLPSTVYHYRVSSIDTSGNQSTPFLGSFTTISLVEELASSTESLESENPEEVKASESILLSTIEKAGELIKSLANRVSVGVLESTLLGQAKIIEELSSILPLPIIGGQPVVEVGSNFAVVSWTTDKLANSLVEFVPEQEFALTRAYDQTVGEPNVGTTDHTVEVKGLRPDTLYHYRVISRTQTGSETKSQDFIFKTKPENNEITNYKVDTLSREEVIFSWSTTVPTDSIITYTPYRNGTPHIDARQTIRDPGFTTQHSLKVAGFEAGVIYDVEIAGVDSGKNVASKVIRGFSTDGEDLPPIISQVQTDSAIIPGGKEKIQIIISWNTNELSTSKVYYRKGFASEDTEFVDATILDQNYTKKHIVVVTNFEPGTVYQFVAESVDSSGNVGKSKTMTILTPRKEESVFQVIMSNVESMFSWVGKIRS